MAQFYEFFARRVHESIDADRWHVHVLSYAGHQLDGRPTVMDAANGGGGAGALRLHGLEIQVPHKLAFLDWLQLHDRDSVIASSSHPPQAGAVGAAGNEGGLSSEPGVIPGETEPLQFVLFGHSIGSWVCLQVRFCLPRIHFILLLHHSLPYPLVYSEFLLISFEKSLSLMSFSCFSMSFCC